MPTTRGCFGWGIRACAGKFAERRRGSRDAAVPAGGKKESDAARDMRPDLGPQRFQFLSEQSPQLPLAGLRLLSPVANPGKIIAPPVNYQKHLDEVKGDAALHQNTQTHTITIQKAGLFLKATSSLLERKDVIIVASVSCIYGLGSPDNYKKLCVGLEKGRTLSREVLRTVRRQVLKLAGGANARFLGAG